MARRLWSAVGPGEATALRWRRSKARHRYFPGRTRPPLRLVVFEHSEVFALQVAHRIAIPVAHGHVHQHQFALGPESVLTGRFLRSNARAQQHNDQREPQQWSDGRPRPSAARNGWPGASEPEPRGQLQGTHPSHGNHPAVGGRVHDGVNPHVLGRIENIRELRPKLQETRFAEGENLGECHIEQPAARSLDTVAAGIAERAGRGDERSSC